MVISLLPYLKRHITSLIWTEEGVAGRWLSDWLAARQHEQEQSERTHRAAAALVQDEVARILGNVGCTGAGTSAESDAAGLASPHGAVETPRMYSEIPGLQAPVVPNRQSHLTTSGIRDLVDTQRGARSSKLHSRCLRTLRK